MKNTQELADLNIVDETIERISEERKQALLRTAVSSALSGSFRKDDDYETQLKKLFHKAQSLMEGEKSHEWTKNVMDNFGVDARNGKSVRGPRRKVKHFVMPKQDYGY